MTVKIYVHTLEDDKIHKFEDLTEEQKKTLEKRLIEQLESVPLRMADETA